MPKGYLKDGTKIMPPNLTGYKYSDEFKKTRYIGENNAFFGKKHSEETKEKWSIKRKGKQLEDDHPNWKGDDVGYFGLHRWVQKKLGKPDKCEFCDTDGLTKNKIHWANKSRLYLRDISDWIRLCVPCHKKYDLARINYVR